MRRCDWPSRETPASVGESRVLEMPVHVKRSSWKLSTKHGTTGPTAEIQKTGKSRETANERNHRKPEGNHNIRTPLHPRELSAPAGATSPRQPSVPTVTARTNSDTHKHDHCRVCQRPQLAKTISAPTGRLWQTAKRQQHRSRRTISQYDHPSR